VLGDETTNEARERGCTAAAAHAGRQDESNAAAAHVERRDERVWERRDYSACGRETGHDGERERVWGRPAGEGRVVVAGRGAWGTSSRMSKVRGWAATRSADPGMALMPRT
jgi:hypothetical protein